MLSKLSGWSRAALVFTIVWCACVIGLAVYERFVTIGDTSGPWVLYGHYGSLVFHQVEINGETFFFWLQNQMFYTTLCLPPFIAWLFAAVLLPALRWVRRGFRT
jgi:hypothetical protein